MTTAPFHSEAVAGPRLQWLALFLLAVAKLGLLAVFGPAIEPDWYGYSAYADIILQDTRWLHDAGLDQIAVPITVFRPIGYPLLIAGARLLAGPGAFHLDLIILVQICVSLAATVCIYRLGEVLLRSRRLALLATAAYSVSITLTYDQSLLTDSLFNSCFIIVFTVPARGLLLRRSARPATLIGLGMVFAVACVMRGIGIYFTVLVFPLLFAWCWAMPLGRARQAALAAAALAPVVLTVGGVEAWNAYRTGHAFFTTGAQFVMIQPLVKAAGRGHDLFTGDTPIDRLARRELRDYSYPEAVRLVDLLFTEYGLDAYHSAQLQSQEYFSVFFRHPLALLENGFNNYREEIIYQFFNAVENTLIYSRMVADRQIWFGNSRTWRQFRQDGATGPLVLLVVVTLARAVSWAAFLLFALGAPVLAVRTLRQGRPWPPEPLVTLYLWGLFYAYTVGLSMIHMVLRFVPAVLPAALLGTLFVWQQLMHRREPVRGALPRPGIA